MILCIVGPTGVGKTKLSIALAKKYNAIIINCDAVQVYKDLNVGSAKIKSEEMENIPHYLIDICDISEEYNVYDYQKFAREILEKNKEKNIIFVGGTGLYLKSVLYDYRFQEENNLNNDYSNLTNEELYNLVLKKDPNTKIHPNNRVRLERFLNKKDTTIIEPKPLYNHLIIGLTTERNILYQHINDRVDKMIEDGLIDEVKKLYNKNTNSRVLKSAIGYKEIIMYLNNELSKEEAISLIKKNSRHYAKRQYTFFNNQFNTNWFNVDFNNFNKTIEEIENFIEKNKNS